MEVIMYKGQNYNRPKKNSIIKVDPIRKKADITKIKKSLESNPRNLALFYLGINTNLRAGDIINIKVSQIIDIENGGKLTLRERKTGKIREIELNKSVIKAIKRLLATKTYTDNDYIFQSQRAEKLTVPSVTRLVKSWCEKIGLKGNYGSHSLRKTFGYHQRVHNNTSIPLLMVLFNHRCQEETLKYLGIDNKEVQTVYKYEI